MWVFLGKFVQGVWIICCMIGWYHSVFVLMLYLLRYLNFMTCTLYTRNVRTRISADPQIFLRTRTVRGSAKHICGRGPSADLQPPFLLARPTSNGSANVPVLSNLRTNPYLDTAVGYMRKPVWLCGALGIVYWIQCNCNLTLLADADGPRTSVAITAADADRPRTWCLRTRIIRGREICGSAHLWWEAAACSQVQRK